MIKKCFVVFLSVLLIFVMLPAKRVSYAADKINGVNVVYYWTGDWNNTSSALNRLKADNFNYIAICIIWYQNSKNSTEMKPDKDMSPPDSAVLSLIREARSRGFRVMLRPYINIKNENEGSWEGQIDFGNNEALWNKWFSSYEKFILHYAKMAQKEHVALFSVGAELQGTVKETAHWEKVIEDVRKVYSGKILYSANGGNEENVKFFNLLDYISVDFYYTLSEKSNPTEKDFENAFRNEYIPELRALSEKYGKPIILSEIGYRSIHTAFKDPWDYDRKGITDYKMQAELYEAFFNTLYREDFLKGVFLWYAPPSMEEYREDYDKYYKNDYAFFDKPAEDVIKNAFEEESPVPAKNPLLSIRTAAACYSEDENYIRNLASHLDLIILQTRFLDLKFDEEISKKTLVAGYVSVLEFDGEKSDLEKYGLKKAVLGKNGNWGSYIMDINDLNYQNYVLKQVQAVFDTGAQGVFLDTIDDVENYPQLKPGTIKFLKALHEKYPDKFFIMNRGFDVLDSVADDIQGILFEDFGTYYDFGKKCYRVFSKGDLQWIENMARKLKKYQDEGKLRILASGYAPSEFSPLVLFSENLAKRYGFAFYASDLQIEYVYLRFAYPFPKSVHIFAE